MNMQQNTRITRLIRFLTYENDSGLEFDEKAFCRRLVGVIGVNGAIILFQRRNRVTIRGLLDGLPLAIGIPLLRRLLGQKDGSWLIGLAVGVSQLKQVIPHWIVSYWTVESVTDQAKLWVSYGSFSEHHWIILRQLAVSILLPIFYHRNVSRGRLYRILFQQRKPWKDFVLLFMLWNLVKRYKSIKQLLLKERPKTENDKRSSMTSSFSTETEASHAQQGSTTRMLIERIDELRQLSDGKSRTTLKERIYGFFFNEMSIKCVRWTLWRQVVMHIFNGSHAECLKPFHKSIITMLSFTLLSDPDPLDVHWSLVKFLGKGILTEELKRVPHIQKYIIYSALNLGYFTKRSLRQQEHTL